MACPFFMPTEKLDGAWLHPARLPLGAGWRGYCSAPGHDGAVPSEEDLSEQCNLGYARCSRLPQQRDCDAVRFSVARDYGEQVTLCYVRERGHLPAGHGALEYEVALGRWRSPHSDPRIQKMAECYLQSYLLRRIHPAPTGTHVSANP